MKRNLNFVSAILGVVFLVSCGSEPASDTQNDADQEVESQESLEVQETEEFILPSTVQIGDLFRNSGLEYVSGLTLDPEKASNYNTSYDKYFAFGVYWTDMTYCILNQQTQEARKYMKSIKSLSEDLGIGEVLNDQAMLERFDRNLSNNDSILMILIEIDEKTDRFVEENEQGEFALIAFVGGWAEGMYLGVSTTSVEEHTKLSGRIIEQMVILEHLIKGLKAYEGNSRRLDVVLRHMEGMYDFYVNIPVVASNEEGNIADLKIPSTDMKLIGEKVNELRKLIVE